MGHNSTNSSFESHGTEAKLCPGKIEGNKLRNKGVEGLRGHLGGNYAGKLEFPCQVSTETNNGGVEQRDEGKTWSETVGDRYLVFCDTFSVPLFWWH